MEFSTHYRVSYKGSWWFQCIIILFWPPDPRGFMIQYDLRIFVSIGLVETTNQNMFLIEPGFDDGLARWRAWNPIGWIFSIFFKLNAWICLFSRWFLLRILPCVNTILVKHHSGNMCFFLSHLKQSAKLSGDCGKLGWKNQAVYVFLHLIFDLHGPYPGTFLWWSS